MYKLWRYYNQNRKTIWAIIIIIVIIYSVIRLLNLQARRKNIEKNDIDKETTSNVVSYRNESESMVTGESISSEYRDKFGSFITEFFTACVEHDIKTAYSMLSNDTKQELYQTEELFQKNYYENKFQGNKQFSFQLWSSNQGIHIYQVKIFDNMLSTGKTSDNYIEEYVTIKSEYGEYKLNINSYLGRTTIDKKNDDDKLLVQVTKVDSYLDYEIYTMSVQNKLNKKILLDTKRETDTCYIQDSLDNKFAALLYENKEEDLILKPNEIKTLKIKFSNSNRVNMKIKSINFTDIVNSAEYANNTNIKGEIFKIDI